MKKWLIMGIGLIVCGVVMAVFFIILKNKKIQIENISSSPVTEEENTAVIEEKQGVVEESKTEERETKDFVTLPTRVLITDVPFTVQAPFAEWQNPLFQDACEEAAIIMAQAWISEQSLSKERAKQEILSLAQFEKKKFGHAIDTSIEDTAGLLTSYYGITTAEVRTNIQISDIYEAVSQNKLVIVPTDGRKLKNPYFKQPGPSRHMLVIVGYDRETAEFIVNDPGTRRGEKYRYSETVLYEALLDYPTGDHVPATSTDTVMLTVWR